MRYSSRSHTKHWRFDRVSQAFPNEVSLAKLSADWTPVRLGGFQLRVIHRRGAPRSRRRRGTFLRHPKDSARDHPVYFTLLVRFIRIRGQEGTD